jgi:hypothetical protein
MTLPFDKATALARNDKRILICIDDGNSWPCGDTKEEHLHMYMYLRKPAKLQKLY